jgi:hypothetical protein
MKEDARVDLRERFLRRRGTVSGEGRGEQSVPLIRRPVSLSIRTK